MSFIRPEIAAQLRRWREALIGGVLAFVGLWCVMRAGGGLWLLGWAQLIAGLGLIYTGLQRARFRTGQGGPGVVQVDEGALTYFGPLTGGEMSVSDLSRIELEPNALPQHWVLTDSGGNHLSIPLNAEGAEVLFDVFAALPGMKTETMLAQLRTPPLARSTLWNRAQATQH